MSDERLLIPSPRLQGQLFSGALAVLASGALSIIGSAVILTEGQKPGFTIAHGFAWASLVPLLVVLRTYQVLAHEANNASLRKSAQCLFGGVVLFHLLELAALNVLPWLGQIGVWVIFVLGMLALISAPFVSSSELTPRGNEKKEDANTTSRTGTLGGIGVGLLILLKLAGKGFLGKWIAFRMIGRLLQNAPMAGEFLGWSAVLLLTLLFTVWFAVAKMRLRDQLGGVAVLVGVIEILLLLAVGVALVWCLVDLEAAADKKGLEEQWNRVLAVVSIASDALWSTATAFLFWSLRGRFDPDREWFDDLEPARFDAQLEAPEVGD